ncbi:MAG: disulfide bond formation protein DsbA [Proteobacteria bacterium]|nr:MAG: disulfide bond formation protein DsbA [Pseudomonadota bacterium]
MVSVEFLFDVGSPNAYFAHRVIPEIERRTSVTFAYVPVLLGGIFKLTGNCSPVETFGHIKNKRAFMELEMRRFMRRHRVPFRFNPHFPVNTLHLMRAATAAQMDGGLAPYVEAVFHHMWEEPKRMDDPAMARAALMASGIDADRLFARAQEADVKARLMEATQDAVERGAFGSPTFFVGREMFFGKDQLRDVEDEIAAQKA